MATQSPIGLLKNLFLTFFSDLDPDYKAKLSKYRFNDREYERQARILKEKSMATFRNGKTIVLGLATTVTSLVGVIGQAGVDAYNVYLATYANGSAEFNVLSVAALKKWYDQYLRPLS